MRDSFDEPEAGFDANSGAHSVPDLPHDVSVESIEVQFTPIRGSPRAEFMLTLMRSLFAEMKHMKFAVTDY